MTYDDVDLCKHYQAITQTNGEFSWMKPNDIHLRAILQEMPQTSITLTILKIIYLFCFQISQGRMS